MSKIIIENNSNLNDIDAIEYIQAVIAKGRVSGNGKQYCYHSVFRNNISVSAFLNKKSDRFVINNSKP